MMICFTPSVVAVNGRRQTNPVSRAAKLLTEAAQQLIVDVRRRAAAPQCQPVSATIRQLG
jgi:hypothetical protein